MNIYIFILFISFSLIPGETDVIPGAGRRSSLTRTWGHQVHMEMGEVTSGSNVCGVMFPTLRFGSSPIPELDREGYQSPTSGEAFAELGCFAVLIGKTVKSCF